jgi:hypothetical protein
MPDAPHAVLPEASGGSAPTAPVAILAAAGGGSAPSSPVVILAAAAAAGVAGAVTVAGAGNPEANGTYVPYGTVNGKVAVSKTGADAVPRISWALGGDGYWVIELASDANAYTAPDDVDSPDLVTEWTADGDPPAPTVTAGGVAAPVSILGAAGGGSAPSSPVVILAAASGGSAPSSPVVILGAAGGGSAPTAPAAVLAVASGGSAPARPVGVIMPVGGWPGTLTLDGADLTLDGVDLVLEPA